MELRDFGVRQHAVIDRRVGDVGVLVLAALVAKQHETAVLHRRHRRMRPGPCVVFDTVDERHAHVRDLVVGDHDAHPLVRLDARHAAGETSLVSYVYSVGRVAGNPHRAVSTDFPLKKSVVVVDLVRVVWNAHVHHDRVAAVVRKVVIALEAVVHANIDVSVARQDAVRPFREAGGTGTGELLEVVADRRLRDVPGGERPFARQARLRVVRQLALIDGRLVVQLHVVDVHEVVLVAFVGAEEKMPNAIDLRERFGRVVEEVLVRAVRVVAKRSLINFVDIHVPALLADGDDDRVPCGGRHAVLVVVPSSEVASADAVRNASTSANAGEQIAVRRVRAVEERVPHVVVHDPAAELQSPGVVLHGVGNRQGDVR